MAEEMGFEPTVPNRYTPLAGEPFQPLRHPSKNFKNKKWRRNRDSNPG